MQYGYVKVSAAIPLVSVADTKYNVEQMIALAHSAHKEGAEITVFPELCITGYTCGDLFLQSRIIEAGDEALEQLLATPRPIVSIIGMPIYYKNNLLQALFCMSC